MRVRLVGAVVGAALLWALVPLGASAAECETDAEADVAIPGERLAQVDVECTAPAGIMVSGEHTTEQNEDGTRSNTKHRVEQGEEHLISGGAPASIPCPDEEDQTFLTGLSCEVHEIVLDPLGS